MTVLDVFDEYALSSPVREELYKCYPNAKLAHLKSGGNFPYLSRSDEVNLYLQVYFFFRIVRNYVAKLYEMTFVLSKFEYPCVYFIFNCFFHF